MSNIASALKAMLASILQQKSGPIVSKTLLSKLTSHNVVREYKNLEKCLIDLDSTFKTLDQSLYIMLPIFRQASPNEIQRFRNFEQLPMHSDSPPLKTFLQTLCPIVPFPEESSHLISQFWGPRVRLVSVSITRPETINKQV